MFILHFKMVVSYWSAQNCTSISLLKAGSVSETCGATEWSGCRHVCLKDTLSPHEQLGSFNIHLHQCL